MAVDRFRHIVLPFGPESLDYAAKPGRSTERIPHRDRQRHSRYLRERLARAWQDAEDERAVIHVERHGVYLEFRSDPDADLLTKSLDNVRSGVRLLNVRKEIQDGQEVTFATVYVPNDRRGYFTDRIERYALEQTASGRPRHADLVNSIADVRKALHLLSFWQDDRDLIPEDDPVWCEVWLSSDTEQVYERFLALLRNEGIQVADGSIVFPERRVVLIRANREHLQRLTRFQTTSPSTVGPRSRRHSGITCRISIKLTGYRTFRTAWL